MIPSALILILAGLGACWIAITEFNIPAGVLGALILLAGIDLALFRWALHRERRAIERARRG